jgi:hypothetical protein
MTIPFVEEEVIWRLGQDGFLARTRPATPDQLTNLREHCDAIEWAVPVARYLLRLNTNWRGDL